MQVEVTFCDLARQEASGKYLLVGVYASDAMFVPYIPGEVNITAFARIKGLPEGRTNISSTLFQDSPGGRHAVAGFSNYVDVKYPHFPTPVILGPIRINLVSTGYLFLDMAIHGPDGVSTNQHVGALFVGKSPDNHTA